MWGGISRASTLPGLLAAHASWGGEAALVTAIDGYSYSVDGPVHKTVNGDYFRAGMHCSPLLFRYGNLKSYYTWYKKTIAAFRGIGGLADLKGCIAVAEQWEVGR